MSQHGKLVLLGTVATGLAAAALVAAQPASATTTNLECQALGNYQLSCDLYKSGKSDYVSTDWQVNGADYASNVNFVTIDCPGSVVSVSADWTDSTGSGGAEFLKVNCY